MKKYTLSPAYLMHLPIQHSDPLQNETAGPRTHHGPPSTISEFFLQPLLLPAYAKIKKSAPARVLNRKRDIVDTILHAPSAARHNTTKQTSFPLSWSARVLLTWNAELVCVG